MAYNEALTARIRHVLAEYTPVEELTMMGGLCFMYNGKMLAGVVRDELMCRVDPELVPELIERPGCRQMTLGNRTMNGYILVDETALRRPQDFRSWLGMALDFNDRAKASRSRKRS